MFVLYSVSNIMGILNVKDEKFVKHNKNYISVIANKIDKDKYLSYEKDENIYYMMPGDSMATFTVKYDYYYQTINAVDRLSGSLSSLSMINKDNLLYGRMPENDYEIVVDKMSINNMFNNHIAKQVGITTVKDVLGLIASINNMPTFTIVGITDLKSPCIYTDEKLFINILSNTTNSSDMFDFGITEVDVSVPGDITKLVSYELLKDKITLKGGRLPENDYEVIANYEYRWEYELNKEIQVKVNDKKLKVVGYYASNDYSGLLTNDNTIKYSLFDTSKNITVYPKDKKKVINSFKENDINVIDSYNKDRADYINKQKNTMISSIVIAGVVLVISLVEIFLMMRSSFLSRIKEVGIYRAIGVKKKDICKMFLGEILAITLTASLLGFIFMAYILKNMSTLIIFRDRFLYNPLVLIISLSIIFGFNILVGLIPVFNTIRKSPAQILSRTDID